MALVSIPITTKMALIVDVGEELTIISLPIATNIKDPIPIYSSIATVVQHHNEQPRMVTVMHVPGGIRGELLAMCSILRVTVLSKSKVILVIIKENLETISDQVVVIVTERGILQVSVVRMLAKNVVGVVEQLLPFIISVYSASIMQALTEVNKSTT